MLLKIRYKKITTLEAIVEVPSGLSKEQTLAVAEDEADTQDSWKCMGEIDGGIEIVEEVGRIPTIREDK